MVASTWLFRFVGPLAIWVLCGLALTLAGHPVELPAGSSPAAEPAKRAAEALPAVERTGPAVFSGARDLLRLYDIDDKQLGRLLDGRPIHEEEMEALLKILFRIDGFPLDKVEQWAHRDVELASLTKNPQASRGEFFHLQGRVASLEVCTLPPEAAERFQFPQYYRCQFLIAPSQSAVVYARTVPKPWQKGGPINQRAAARGLLLKLGSQDADHPMPIFVASRIASYPNTPLGDLGMDVGLLEEVENRKSLAYGEREAFYQMLAAVGRAKPGQLLAEAEKELGRTGRENSSVVPLFNEPDTQRGRLVVLAGSARQVIKIAVDEPDIHARFGIDHYYEIALFTDDSQENPLMFCVRELPQGMPTGDGPKYGEFIRVAGFFYKTWGYRTAESVTAQPGGGVRRQLAPLLIGQQPVWYPHEKPARNLPAEGIAGGLFALALLVAWLAARHYNRRSKELRKRILAKGGLEAGVSLDTIGPDSSGQPDFSKLREPGRPGPESSGRQQ